MAEKSNIEWTDATWQIVTGCTVLSPGCTNCYAMKLAGTRLKHHPSRANLTTMTKAGPVWNGAVRFNREWLEQPFGWKKPKMIFVAAHGDLFHENVEDAWLEQIFAVMALTQRHTYQILTKRPARLREIVSRIGKSIEPLERAAREMGWTLKFEGQGLVSWPLPNVWLGVSAERQQEADERIPELLNTPAAIRFVSLEPLLGPIDLTHLEHDKGQRVVDATNGCHAFRDSDDWEHSGQGHSLDWVIVGGESGSQARPMRPDWARSLRLQCKDAGVAFFFKQWGEWAPYNRSLTDDSTFVVPFSADEPLQRFGKHKAGRLLDGVEHNGMPEQAR